MTFALELTGISLKSRFCPANKFLRQNNDNLISFFLIWLQKNGVVFGSSIPIIRDAKKLAKSWITQPVTCKMKRKEANSKQKNKLQALINFIIFVHHPNKNNSSALNSSLTPKPTVTKRAYIST